jgi:hypothetical protein
MTKRWLPLLVILATLALAAARAAPSSMMFDAQVLLNDLKILSADDMQGRRVDTPGGEKARQFIVERFKASGIVPVGDSYLEPFTYAPGVHGVNVVGLIPGNRVPQRYVIVSAHYDHLGVRNGAVFNGADDNASGAASLFTIGAYFKTHRPENSLLLVAFDAEEPGLKGSQAFVAGPPVDKSAIVADINIDMIGREANDRLFVVGVRRNPFLKPVIDAVAAKAPLKLITGHDDPSQKDIEDWSNDSDHASFQRAGIPAIYLGVEDYAHHHRPTDKYETISFDFYVRAVETSILVIDAFDKNLDTIARH